MQTNLLSVSNPINAFRLIKKLAQTWKDLQAEMRSDIAGSYLQNISIQKGSRFPTDVCLLINFR